MSKRDRFSRPNSARLEEHRPRRGQTLVEFALTLPLLLLLMFGIIEFGRIFQAWVTLQNAARTAARYASTGQFFEDQPSVESIFPDKTKPGQADGLIPCVEDGPTRGSYGAADQRGTQTTIAP